MNYIVTKLFRVRFLGHFDCLQLYGARFETSGHGAAFRGVGTLVVRLGPINRKETLWYWWFGLSG